MFSYQYAPLVLRSGTNSENRFEFFVLESTVFRIFRDFIPCNPEIALIKKKECNGKRNRFEIKKNRSTCM